MSAEFSARQAREITDHKDDWNCELWYAKFKDHIFDEIQKAALKGHDHLALNMVNWNENKSKANYLDKRLSALGYKVYLRTDTNEIVLSW